MEAVEVTEVVEEVEIEKDRVGEVEGEMVRVEGIDWVPVPPNGVKVARV